MNSDAVEKIIKKLRRDCRLFEGELPCRPHRERGAACTCEDFMPRTRRGLIVKLGAAGDVYRTTPMLRIFEPGAEIFWITNYPELLPLSACRPMRPTGANLSFVNQAEWDFCWNFDKDLVACGIASGVRAASRSGFILVDGRPAPTDELSWHKFATGVDNAFSRRNRKSYPEEVFEMVGKAFNGEEYWLQKPSEEAAIENDMRFPYTDWVGLNTGASSRWISRIWPQEYWKELAERLKGKGLRPIFLGGPEEATLNRELSESTGIPESGSLPVERFFELIHRCRLVVSGVTMAMHLAIAARKPLVLLNNIFNRNEFELYRRGEIVEPDIPCDCFYDRTCKSGRCCMREITPETVMGAVLRWL